MSRQIGDAKERGADVALLRRCTEEVLDFARRLRVWVVLGSTHPLTAPHKPHNSLYMIDDRGGIVDRYDKTFCAGDRAEDTDDLAHYSPGGYLGVFEIGASGAVP